MSFFVFCFCAFLTYLNIREGDPVFLSAAAAVLAFLYWCGKGKRDQEAMEQGKIMRAQHLENRFGSNPVAKEMIHKLNSRNWCPCSVYTDQVCCYQKSSYSDSCVYSDYGLAELSEQDCKDFADFLLLHSPSPQEFEVVKRTKTLYCAPHLYSCDGSTIEYSSGDSSEVFDRYTVQRKGADMPPKLEKW